MSQRTQALFGTALLVSAVCISAIAYAEPPKYQGQGFVLLENGRVIEGKITSLRDRVSVLVDGNSTINIDAKQVAFAGPSLEALYQNQRSSVRQWGTGEHWHLAHWCIQYGLLDHAIEHYEYLEKNASDSPRFKQLEHLLREALLTNEKVRSAIKPQDPDVVVTQAKDNSQVVQASAIAATPKTKLVADPANEPPRDEWAQHEIPSYIRQSFHTSILPILVARCGQSGCHGLMGKSEFHIYQPVGDQSSTILARDLDAVLRYIDRDHSSDSELLAYATKPHGIQKNPSFSAVRADDQALVTRITQWIKSLELSKKVETNMPAQYPLAASSNQPVGSTGGVSQAVATSPVVEKDRAGRIRSAREFDGQDRKAKLSKPAKSAPPAVFLTGGELSELEAAIDMLEKKAAANATGEANTNKDPFDPNEFNRKYR